MKKLLTALAVGSLCAMPIEGKTYQTKNYGVMQTNDIYSVTVGPGTVETRTAVSYKSYTSTVNILQVDLTNPYVTAKVAFADEHKIQDVKLTVPKLMENHTSYANHYFAGVNADFFGFITCGVTVADGTYVYAGNWLTTSTAKDPPADSFFEGTHFIIDKDGLPYIADHIEFGNNLGIRNGYSGPNSTLGEVTFSDGSKLDELRINGLRDTDHLVLYSPYPETTAANSTEWGTEVELKKSYGNRTIFGGEGEFTVGKVTKTGVGGNMTIPHNGYVLSGHGKRKFDDKVATGSKVKVSIPFKADGVANSCRETVGGWPRLVTNDAPLTSVPSNTPGDLQGSSQRARTAVGFSKDRKTLYIVVVEEKDTKGTNGMTFIALGNFMQAIGCYNAMALDGGGSSVMHVENLGQRCAVQGVMPGNNRPVMNGLFLVTDAPENREITSIEIVDKSLTIKPGGGYVPTIYGYNKYGVLVCTNVTEFTLSASAGSVTFNSGNRKMIAPSSGEFTLTAKYKNATYSIPVKVSSSGIAGVGTSATTFSAQKTTPVPTKPADWEEQPIYVAGNFNSWNPYNPILAYAVEGNPDVYEFDAEFDKPLEFKFTTLNPGNHGGWNAFKAGNNGEGFSWHVDNILAPGKEVPLVPGNAGNITTPWAGKFHVRIDLGNETICVTTTSPRPAIEVPEHLYLIGTLEGHTWDVAYTGAELKGKDGVFTIKDVELTGNDAYFAFTTKVDTDKDVVNSYPRYGAWKAFVGIPDKTDDFFESHNSWKVAPGVYDITMDFNTGKVKIEPVIHPVYALLENITPSGYNWDNYPVGPFKARQIPTNISDRWWTAPGGTYSQELMDEAGAVISIHQWGVGADVNNDELFADLQNGLSIQDLGGYIGKVLVYNQQFGPGANVHGWPYSTKYPATQISFYMDANEYYNNPMGIRVRLVFQVLHRGRHTQDDWQIPNIYACAANASTAWPIKHNDIGDDETGKKFPIDAKYFYRWENEGDCIAEMPEEKVLLNGNGTQEPWDENRSDNQYLINAERFIVYEWDLYPNHNGTIGVHLNINGNENRYNTYIFKEIKFYHILNSDEVTTQPRSSAPLAVRAKAKPFTSTSVSGSLAGTRNISYRYYTENGIAEIEDDNEPDNAETTGVEEVIDDNSCNMPAEYFNLQGVRVSNPSNGIFIVRQGDKVSKVLLH